MKKSNQILIIAVALIQFGNGAVHAQQTDTIFHKKKINQVVYLDMSVPGFQSVRVEREEHHKKKETVYELSKLEIPASKTTSIVLENGNPLKYTYSIDATPVSFFAAGNPFDTLIAKFDAQAPVTPAASGGKAGDIPKVQQASKGLDSTLSKTLSAVRTVKLTKKLSKKSATTSKTTPDSTKVDIQSLVINIKNYSGQAASASVDSLKTRVIDSLTKLPGKTVLRQTASNIIKSASTEMTGKMKKNAPDSAAAVSIDKILTLWLETRRLYEHVLYYETKAKAEDYLYAENYTQYIDTLERDFDTVINRYIAIYHEVKWPENNNLDSNQTAELDSLQKWLPRTISNLKTARDFLAGTQLHYYSLPIDINGGNYDALQVTVNRTLIKDPSKTDPHIYNLWITGGVKIDASAGVFLTSLVDNQYYTTDDTAKADTAKTNKIIQKKATGNLAFGFGSMVDLSWRTGASWFRPSVNFGVLFTTTTTQKFQLLSGLGLNIGKQQRGIIHFGAAFGTVTTLENGYTVGKAYNIGSGSTAPTDEKFQVGYYFGFSYNITKPNIKSNSGN